MDMVNANTETSSTFETIFNNISTRGLDNGYHQIFTNNFVLPNNFALQTNSRQFVHFWLYQYGNTFINILGLMQQDSQCYIISTAIIKLHILCHRSTNRLCFKLNSCSNHPSIRTRYRFHLRINKIQYIRKQSSLVHLYG